MKSEAVKNSSSNFLIETSQFEVSKDKLLGKGSFGKVYEGTYFKLPVAVKTLKTVHTPQALEDFRHEIQTLMYTHC
jgi:serine/threonine protein kinase